MRKPGIARHLRHMRRNWDRRAKENARYYVATGQEEGSDQELYQGGEQELRDHIINDLGNICQGKDPKSKKVLEIGCGAGRVTAPLAQFFREVHAVDISRHMVRHARQAVAAFPNAYIYHNNGRDLTAIRRRWWHRFGLGPKLQFDFAFSCLVFQHIPSLDVIEGYVREVNRLLRPRALFKFQVQGDPKGEPKIEDSWMGVSFNEESAREYVKTKPV